jgi:predicted ribosomally synthesized peptide with nif11-like leader
MSEEQLSALLAKLKADLGLREKLRGAGDLDAAVAIAKEAGFDVSRADWLRYEAKQTLELSDAELEAVAGGTAKEPEFCEFSYPTQTDLYCNEGRWKTGAGCR